MRRGYEPSAPSPPGAGSCAAFPAQLLGELDHARARGGAGAVGGGPDDHPGGVPSRDVPGRDVRAPAGDLTEVQRERRHPDQRPGAGTGSGTLVKVRFGSKVRARIALLFGRWRLLRELLAEVERAPSFGTDADRDPVGA
jgi:hypothetical protein